MNKENEIPELEKGMVQYFFKRILAKKRPPRSLPPCFGKKVCFVRYHEPRRSRFVGVNYDDMAEDEKGKAGQESNKRITVMGTTKILINGKEPWWCINVGGNIDEENFNYGDRVKVTLEVIED